jgi:hypothetical protein
MKFQLTRAIALGALVALSLGACGGGDTEPAVAADEPAETVSVEDYASEVCTAFQAWGTAFQEQAAGLGAGFGAGDDEAIKATVQKFYGDLADATDEAITAIEAAGIPDVDNGAEAAEEIQNAFAELRAVFEEAEASVADAPTDDPDAFNAEVKEINAQLQEGLDEATSGMTETSSKEVSDAIENHEGCAGIGA